MWKYDFYVIKVYVKNVILIMFCLYFYLLCAHKLYLYP